MISFVVIVLGQSSCRLWKDNESMSRDVLVVILATLGRWSPGTRRDYHVDRTRGTTKHGPKNWRVSHQSWITIPSVYFAQVRTKLNCTEEDTFEERIHDKPQKPQQSVRKVMLSWSYSITNVGLSALRSSQIMYGTCQIIRRHNTDGNKVAGFRSRLLKLFSPWRTEYNVSSFRWHSTPAFLQTTLLFGGTAIFFKPVVVVLRVAPLVGA